MTAPHLDATISSDLRLAGNASFWEPEAECTVVMSQPLVNRDLWHEFLRGADRSYRRHGVERVLDIAAIRDGEDTSLFWAIVDTSGRVVGGLRAKGPLNCADESHAVIEWAGQPGLLRVRRMITDRLPFGVIEMKSAWVADDVERKHSLTNILARLPLHSTAVLGTQFAVATAASHVIARWVASGGVVASRIPATAYPDDRYRTKVMWWDRHTYANSAEPKQASKTVVEIMALNQQLDELYEVATPQASPV
ncbi:hypothetical protein [Mycobacterium sp. MMS18-G62]